MSLKSIFEGGKAGREGKSKPFSRLLMQTLGSIALLSLILSCSGSGSSSGCGGCGGMKPIPEGGFKSNEKIQRLVQIRATTFAFDFLKTQVPLLIPILMGDQGLSFELKDGSVVNSVGTVFPKGDTTITLAINDVNMWPEAPNKLWIQIWLVSPNKNRLEINIPGSVLWIPCTLKITSNGPFSVKTAVSFNIASPENILTFEVGQPDFDINQINLSGCATDIVNPFKSLFKNMINDMVAQQIDKALAGFLCYSCKDGAACPNGSSCSEDVCRQTNGKCMPKPLGIEGAINLSELINGALAGAAPDNAELYFSLAAGGYADADTGLNIGMIGGTKAPNKSECVNPVNYPLSAPPRFNFGDYNKHNPEGLGVPYHIGIGVTETLLNQAGANLYNTGALCLSLDTSNPMIGSYLSMGTFGMLLSSINDLTHGEEVPAKLLIQPMEPIKFIIGEGKFETDAEGKIKLIQPNLTILIPRMRINIYGLIEERVIRLFTIETDIEVAAGLQVADDSTSITPVLGENPIQLKNMSVPFSILGESEEDIKKLIENLIGTAMGFIPMDSLSQPIGLPPLDLNGDDVADLTLKIQNITGDGPKNNPPTEFQMLSIYAELLSGTGGGQGGGGVESETYAWLINVKKPTLETLRNPKITGEANYPEVVILMDSDLAATYGKDVEYSYKIDNWLWSPFFSADRLVLKDSRLAWPGKHTVSVRSRVKGLAGSTSKTPAKVEVNIEYDNPFKKAPKEIKMSSGNALTAPETMNNAAPATEQGGCDASNLSFAIFALAAALTLRRKLLAYGRVLPVLALLIPLVIYGCGSSGSTGKKKSCISSADCEQYGTGYTCENNECVLNTLDGDFAEEEVIEEEETVEEVVCSKHEECRKAGEPDDKYYCSKIKKKCMENPCYGDNADSMCAASDSCSVCLKENGINSCNTPRCESDADCACLNCESGQTKGCDAGTGLCICKKPCGGACPTGKECCEVTGNPKFDDCIECPAWCPGLTCKPGFEINKPADWDGDYCKNKWHKDACAYDQPTNCDPESTAVDAPCKEKAFLPWGNIGRFMDFKVDGETVYFSAYNDGTSEKPYGDLMFGSMPLASMGAYPTDDAENSGAVWEFVDGVPSADPSNGPSGPRSGISEPGEDVGQYTSLALDSDKRPMIAYYDKTNKRLKFARKDAEGKWAVHVVDESGFVGKYAKMVLLSDGRPVITYMVENDDKAANGKSGVRVAVAASTSPAAPEDWRFYMADSALAPRPICYDKCAAEQACVSYDSEGCYGPNDGTCAEACPSGMACRTGICVKIPTVEQQKAICGTDDDGALKCASGKVCLPGATMGCIAKAGDGSKNCDKGIAYKGSCMTEVKLSAMANLSSGIGLWPQPVIFPSINGYAFKDTFAIFYYANDYYDGAWSNVKAGDLKAAVTPISTLDSLDTSIPWEIRVIDGQNTDAGLFPSVAVASNGSFAVSYLDETLHQLKYYRFHNGGGAVVIGDLGKREDANHNKYISFNGADSSVSVYTIDSSLMIKIAYQDQTDDSLRLIEHEWDGAATNSASDLVLFGKIKPEDCTIDNYVCTGAYGFYVKQLPLDNSVTIIGTFYYDLPKKPDGWGIWLTTY